MFRIHYLNNRFALLFCFSLIGCHEISGSSADATRHSVNCQATVPGQALSCFRAQNANLPLTYSPADVTDIDGIQKRHFVLESQDWSPGGIVAPKTWHHDVDIYIPANAFHGRALLVANNGTNIASADSITKPASDFTQATALSVAKATRTIVISVSNIPNQALTYTDDGVARSEDSSVAHSWKLFLQSSTDSPMMLLHLPMMESLVKVMDLAEIELRPWAIKSFIATGASKRGWAVWLAAIADARIDAVVPFVIDILHTDQVLDHIYHSYGDHWPLAFRDYVEQGITPLFKSEKFAQLLQIEDPFYYLISDDANRLMIPKYIVNASGDDFFVPDNTRFYLDQLPGVTALRVAPNSDHYGIRYFIESSLIPLINRIQQGLVLPTIKVTKIDTEPGVVSMQLFFSEKPVKVLQWSANNAVARDFRYACGVRYGANELSAQKNLTVKLTPPVQGWESSFIEAQFADGFVLTSQDQILPDSYPASAPPESAPYCHTISAKI